MNNLNSILIEGNLTRDPEIRKTLKGTSICDFTIASIRYFKLENEYQQEVSFFDVVTWSKLAQTCGEYLKKGQGVRVVGRIKQECCIDEDGKSCTRIFIIAEHVEIKK